MNTFEFYRLRFTFEAVEEIAFGPGESANIIRGAFGAALRRTAPREVYLRIFEPAAAGPSGLRQPPRPFVFRAANLEGRFVLPGECFSVDLHFFAEPDLLPRVETALAGIAAARLLGRQFLNLDGAHVVQNAACRIVLDPGAEAVNHVTVQFVTPTELKGHGRVLDRPEFSYLFGRIRDRISTLSALYGRGPLAVDFAGLGQRAAAVRLERCELTWEHATRKSASTGQVHSLGGFTGEVEFGGKMAEFLPWLAAARWTGVGRHTVWGNGDLRVNSRK